MDQGTLHLWFSFIFSVSFNAYKFTWFNSTKYAYGLKNSKNKENKKKNGRDKKEKKETN